MPFLFIRTRNSGFESRDDGADYARPADALARGVRGAAQIAADEVANGIQAVAVAVSVEDRDGQQLLHSIVMTALAPILVG